MNRQPLAVLVIAGIVLLILGVGIGYGLGNTQGYRAGYKQAETDAKKIQEEAAQKAAQEAARAANPFQVGNPLEGVETNPFEKLKGTLNPFE